MKSENENFSASAKGKPYKLSGRTCGTVAELAQALSENWEEGVKRLVRGSVLDWVKQESDDDDMLNLLQDIHEDKALSGGQKLAAALLVMNPSAPLSWNGKKVSDEWLRDHPKEGREMLKSSLPVWLKKLRSDSLLLEWRDYVANLETQMKEGEAEIADRNLAWSLMFRGEMEVSAEVFKIQRNYSDSPNARLKAWLKEDKKLKLWQAIALVACDKNMLISYKEKKELRRRRELVRHRLRALFVGLAILLAASVIFIFFAKKWAAKQKRKNAVQNISSSMSPTPPKQPLPPADAQAKKAGDLPAPDAAPAQEMMMMPDMSGAMADAAEEVPAQPKSEKTVPPISLAQPNAAKPMPASPAPLDTMQGGISVLETALPADFDSPIDKAVFKKLKAMGIKPAQLCSDEVFLRRVYLDVIGTLPKIAEAQFFIESREPNKRELLIDALLEREEFADYWAMKWGDILRIKAEFPINLWPNAAQAYHRWVRTCLKNNMPYNEMARQMLTANGSNFRLGSVNFYRAMQKKDAAGIAEAVALTFMGVRSEKWTPKQREEMAVFFSFLGYKATAEWKEEIVFFDPEKMNVSGGRLETVFPDGKKAVLSPSQDPRVVFAGWLLAPENKWFTRNIANRVWSWLLGRGIIHETDDIRPDNLPAIPELLTVLEQELVAADYDLKKLYRAILNSRTYQLSSIPASEHTKASVYFAHYPLRRLDAEVLIDALNQISGTAEQYSSSVPEPFTFIPEGQRAITLADASLTSPFLEKFSRSGRDTGYESERNNSFTVDQRLHLLNSSHIQQKIAKCPQWLNTQMPTQQQPEKIINGLYLMILSRYPTQDEIASAQKYFTASGGTFA